MKNEYEIEGPGKEVQKQDEMIFTGKIIYTSMLELNVELKR